MYYEPPDEYVPPTTEAELKIAVYRQRIIRDFLATLTPQDASLDLFSFAERKVFNLTARRKRPPPA